MYLNVAKKIFELILQYGEMGVEIYPSRRITKLVNGPKLNANQAALVYQQSYNEQGELLQNFNEIGELHGESICFNDKNKPWYKYTDISRLHANLALVLQQNLPFYAEISPANQFDLQYKIAINLLRTSFYYHNEYMPNLNGIVRAQLHIESFFISHMVYKDHFPKLLFESQDNLQAQLKTVFDDVRAARSRTNLKQVEVVLDELINKIWLDFENVTVADLYRLSPAKLKSPTQKENLRKVLSQHLPPEINSLLDENERYELANRIVWALHKAVSQHAKHLLVGDPSGNYSFSIEQTKGQDTVIYQLPSLLFDYQTRIAEVLQPEFSALAGRLKYKQFQNLLKTKNCDTPITTFFHVLPSDITQVVERHFLANLCLPKNSAVVDANEKPVAAELPNTGQVEKAFRRL